MLDIRIIKIIIFLYVMAISRDYFCPSVAQMKSVLSVALIDASMKKLQILVANLTIIYI